MYRLKWTNCSALQRRSYPHDANFRIRTPWSTCLTKMQRRVQDDDGFVFTSSASFLAEIPLRSPRKLFIFIIYKYIYRIKVSKKIINWFWKKKHCSRDWCVLWKYGTSGHNRFVQTLQHLSAWGSSTSQRLRSLISYRLKLFEFSAFEMFKCLDEVVMTTRSQWSFFQN